MNSKKLTSVIAFFFIALSINAQSKFNMTIARKLSNENCTMGYLLVNGQTICYTLELPWNDNLNNISCIPTGSYRGVLRYDHADAWRIQLENVPNRTAVQIHVGNYTSDIKGCVLVGEGASVDNCSVSGSRSAYAKLKKAFYGTDSPISSPDYTITVTFED